MSDGGRRSKFREVVFSGGRYRIAWALTGLALGLVGFLVVQPTLGGRPVPPHTWGLYLTTDSLDRHWRTESADWLLTLKLSAPSDCGGPAMVYGELHPDALAKLNHPPHFFSFGVAGAKVERAELGKLMNPANTSKSFRRWKSMRLIPFRHGFIAEGPIPHTFSVQNEYVIYFRFFADVSQGAGYESCYLTSPSLFEFAGADQRWQNASSLTNIYLERSRPHLGTEYAPVSDAVVYMSAEGKIPDRAAIDVGAEVRANRLLLTCTGELPQQPKEGDAFFYERTLLTESSCASAQTFRASDADTSSNLRLFFAGILLSAAMAMLLEALVTGRSAGTPSA